jgi:uncharacterized Zn-finger protein
MNDTPKKEQYVYIMSNACYDDDVVKIGWTSKHPFHRVSQLNTGAPTPFVVDSVIITTEGPRLEKQIHTHLKQYRINREFFKISNDTLREILTNEMSLVLTPITELDEDDNSNTCKYCNKVYTTRTGKWYHEKRCAKNPTYICVGKKKPMDGSKKTFECPHCGKGYDARNSLWYHEQKCTDKPKKTNANNANSIAVMSKMDLDMEMEMESTPIKCIKKMNNPSSIATTVVTTTTTATTTATTATTATTTNATQSNEFNMMKIVEQLMEQNKTLQTQLIELSKERNMVINNTTNTTNQQFNLQVFLNTECKDAVKLSDFVKSLNITVEDLEFTKNNGIIEGVSSIIVNNLKGMDVHKRPIHCTDAKREIMYVKNDEWEKDSDCANIKKFIYLTSCYQIRRIQDWIDAHPGWESKEKLHTEYLALCKELYKNIENDDNAHKKIIKGFIKNIQIDKHK